MLREVVFVVVLAGLAFGQVSADYVDADFIEKNYENPDPSASRIVSGWEALPGQHPHQVALRIVGPAGDVSACGGSVVHRDWVLTAAHCTASGVTVVIRGGVTNLTTPAYIYESTEWYNHPTYDDTRPTVVQPNDISLLRTDRPFVYTHLLAPIRLQSSADAYRNYDQEIVYASGHGRVWTNDATSEVLRWVYLRAVSNSACAALFGSSLITDNTICAAFYNVTSQSTCQGDSGGPLVHVSARGVPTLVGVTSFVAGGSYGCHSGLPAGFIRPGPFLGWLQDMTGIDFENVGEEQETTTPAPTTTEAITTEATTTEATTTEATTTEATTTEATTTEATTTEATTTEATTTEVTTTEATTTEASTTEATTPEATTTTEKPTTESDSSSESDESEELAELIKKLQVKVKVQVQVGNHEHNHKHVHNS